MPKKKEEPELITYDLYLRHTDKDGNSHVTCHRVWDGERFYESQLKAAKKIGGRSDVKLITEAQYRSGKT